MSKSRKFFTFAFFLGFSFIFAATVFAADTTQPSLPPYSLQSLEMRLTILLFASRDTPQVALNHDQVQKILPLLKKWQDNPYLTPAEAKTVFSEFESILTLEQKAFKPQRPGPGPGTGQSAGQGQRGGEQRPRAQQGNDTQNPQDRRLRALERLIDRLKKI